MQTKKNNQKFWGYFWRTIIILFILYIAAMLYISFNNEGMSLSFEQQNALTKEKNGTITITTDFFKRLEEEIPSINQNIESEFNATQEKIDTNIDKQVERLFAPVYQQIPKYTDFHYSLTGEYLEVGDALSGNLAKSIKEKLFDSVNFDNNYQNILTNIQMDAHTKVLTSVTNINEASQKQLKLSNDEMKIFNQVSTVTIDDSMRRFNDITHNILKIGALGAGAKFTTIVIAKVMGKKIAATILAKVAVKSSAKALGIGGGAATGAAAGSIIPGVGTAVGGIIGGLVAWFAVDKVIIEIDEVLHREEFEKELKMLISKQKALMKQEIKNNYAQLLQLFSNDLQKNYQKLKLKEIIDKEKRSKEPI